MDRPQAADVEAAAAGDEAAFERIVRAMQGHVWRYVVHLLGDPALAEDVAQEVFLRVHRKLSTLRDPERFVPWLLAIARNAAYDAGRVRQRSRLDFTDELEEAPGEGCPDPHLVLEVYEAVARLSPQLREALVLVAMVGFSYDEAARSLEVPEGTVKSRVFRARKSLMEELELEVSHE